MIATRYATSVGRPEKPTKTALGQWVRELRHANNMRGADFAAEVGVSESTIRRLENGFHKSADLRSIELILKAFPDAPAPPVRGLSGVPRTLLPEASNEGERVDTELKAALVMVESALRGVDRKMIAEAQAKAIEAIKGVERASHPSGLVAPQAGSRDQRK